MKLWIRLLLAPILGLLCFTPLLLPHPPEWLVPFFLPAGIFVHNAQDASLDESFAKLGLVIKLSYAFWTIVCFILLFLPNFRRSRS